MGTHPSLTQVPPTSRSSINATLAPRFAAMCGSRKSTLSGSHNQDVVFVRWHVPLLFYWRLGKNSLIRFSVMSPPLLVDTRRGHLAALLFE